MRDANAALTCGRKRSQCMVIVSGVSWIERVARLLVGTVIVQNVRRWHIPNIVRAMWEQTLDRAPSGSCVVARGELAVETDLELAADLLAAPTYWRMVLTGVRSDAAYLDWISVTIVAALGAYHDHRIRSDFVRNSTCVGGHRSSAPLDMLNQPCRAPPTRCRSIRDPARRSRARRVRRRDPPNRREAAPARARTHKGHRCTPDMQRHARAEPR